LDLYHFIEKAIRDPAKVKIRRKVALGRNARRIVEVVHEEGIDLVVLGVRNTSSFAHLMAQGKLLRMIAQFPCPVLLRPRSDESGRASNLIWSSIFAR
jgi:nucleotide-binding universal stress UspA family protein